MYRPKQLEDGGVEYEDGTPATASQMAADVSVFLAWAAEPEVCFVRALYIVFFSSSSK